MVKSFWAKRKRKQFSGNKNTAVREFYAAAPIEFRTPVIDSDILSVDLETSGLDHQTDRILSIATMEMKRGAALTSTLNYDIIKQSFTYTDATLVHGLTPQDMELGRPLEDVVESFLQKAKGKVLLAHNVTSDWRFLNRVLNELYGTNFIIPVIDTLKLERRRLERKEAVLSPNSLTLSACRARYGLPEFAEHDPRNDALATAELLLSHMQSITDINKVTLADVATRWYF